MWPIMFNTVTLSCSGVDVSDTLISDQYFQSFPRPDTVCYLSRVSIAAALEPERLTYYVCMHVCVFFNEAIEVKLILA